MFIIGLDLGQSNDYTAISILEKLNGTSVIYHVRKLERTKRTPYPDIVERVRAILTKLPEAALVIDQTGVGQPVVDMFTKSGLRPFGVQIHGGDRVTNEGRTYRVPKRDLVAVLQVLLQNHRLKIAPGLLSDILTNEMLNFKVKIDPTTAHDSYSAWREADHDDLVLATALTCWWGEHGPRQMHIEIPTKPITGRGMRPSMISAMGWDRPTNSWAYMGLPNPY